MWQYVLNNYPEQITFLASTQDLKLWKLFFNVEMKLSPLLAGKERIEGSFQSYQEIDNDFFY